VHGFRIPGADGEVSSESEEAGAEGNGAGGDLTEPAVGAAASRTLSSASPPVSLPLSAWPDIRDGAADLLTSMAPCVT
jgi:hypothetical protein